MCAYTREGSAERICVPRMQVLAYRYHYICVLILVGSTIYVRFYYICVLILEKAE
jgi:hypothetical protein